MAKTKLELTWIGKENRPRLEPRILLEDPDKSYHAPHRVTDKDIFDNRLIFGDNLLALKALEQEFAGKVKCIFIDPPYNNQDARREVLALNPNDPFSTAKPEKLIAKVLQLATREGDWVLDSFAGSGTTGAVAHKMGRRWIMVELGEHCHTHIIPRLKKVIDGEDPGGVTEPTGWKGGGGFRYYRLAPSLLEKDSFGNWIISKQYNPAMLAEAICKLEGFRYAPSETVYWQHGQATESDFIYVTTQTLTRDQIASLSEEVGDKRSLLVMCSAFRVKNMDAFPNLTVKKIPRSVLSRCEWGRDDYSLEIKNLPAPAAEPKPDTPPATGTRAARKARMAAQNRRHAGCYTTTVADLPDTNADQSRR